MGSHAAGERQQGVRSTHYITALRLHRVISTSSPPAQAEAAPAEAAPPAPAPAAPAPRAAVSLTAAWDGDGTQ